MTRSNTTGDESRSTALTRPQLAASMAASRRREGASSPGVGQSHLAIGLGLEAIERGYRVLFATAAGLLAAAHEGGGRAPLR